MDSLTHIKQYKLVAIVRGIHTHNIISVVNALYNGGINTVEVTLNSPNALQSITEVATYFGEKILVGAGTVLNGNQAKQAINAGAKFIISPIVDIDTIEVTKKLGAISIPGAFTPTEIIHAYNHGADIIKVFPASAGPSFIKDVQAPLPHIPLMPTGGVQLNNIKQFLEAGACAFGIGSALVKATETINDNYLQTLTNNSMAFKAAIDS